MRSRMILWLVVYLLFAFPVFAQDEGFVASPAVYRVRAGGCAHDPRDRVLTGFRVQNVKGLVTALHGVVDCASIDAANEDGVELHGLQIASVDIPRDLVVLSSPGLSAPAAGEGLQASSAALSYPDPLQIFGYCLGRYYQAPTQLSFIKKDKLDVIVAGTQARTQLATRKSPELLTQVLSIEGHLLPGHSGAPVLDGQGKLVGVGNGGLEGGHAEISWAIPWAGVTWKSPTAADVKAALVALKKVSPAATLSFSTTFPQEPTDQTRHLKGIVIDATEAAPALPVTGADVTLSLGKRYLITKTNSKGEFAFNVGKSERLEQIAIEAEGYERFEEESLQPWPTTLSLVPKCSLTMIIRGDKSAAVPGASVEITYRNRLYLGETNAAGRYNWSFPCKRDVQSRLVVDAPGYTAYELRDPSKAANPLKIGLKVLVAPHAPPIVKEHNDEILFYDSVMVVPVPAGERVTFEVEDLWKATGDAPLPDCSSAYLRFTWIVREPYPDGGEDLVIEMPIPQSDLPTAIGNGATGAASLGYCTTLTLFNSSLQDYQVEIRYASGLSYWQQ